MSLLSVLFGVFMREKERERERENKTKYSFSRNTHYLLIVFVVYKILSSRLVFNNILLS